VIWERLVAEHGFTGHYQRVKVYVRERRARLATAEPEPVGFHRRFEVLPGAQAQVDWGDEGEIQTATGPLRVSSFHMTLAYSRDPFCCFAAAQDLGTFWDCHRRAFAHFGGVPAVIVYDRSKTVVRRHVGRGQATPLHPEAVAFAGHYDFVIWLAAPYRAQTKGRVERQVEIVRSHVLDGRGFASLGELDAAFAAWLPIRRAQVHRTHGEVIAVRAERDQDALGPLPAQPYVVCDRHTRRVGKDALISFEASHYSVPWRRVRPGARVELRVTPAEVAVWSLGPSQQLLATHPRALQRGGWVVDVVAELIAFRAERMAQGITVGQQYDSLRQPGRSRLRDLHNALDRAVLDLYGFDPDEDLLAQILALNLSLAELEQAGGAVRGPGPQGLPNTARTTWRIEPIHRLI